MKESLHNRFLCIGGWNTPLSPGDRVLAVEESGRKSKLFIGTVESVDELYASVKVLDDLKYIRVFKFNTCKIDYKGIECAGISAKLVPSD